MTGRWAQRVGKEGSEGGERAAMAAPSPWGLRPSAPRALSAAGTAASLLVAQGLSLFSRRKRRAREEKVKAQRLSITPHGPFAPAGRGPARCSAFPASTAISLAHSEAWGHAYNVFLLCFPHFFLSPSVPVVSEQSARWAPVAGGCRRPQSAVPLGCRLPGWCERRLLPSVSRCA